MDNRLDVVDHDELDLLLPWFVNGTLKGAEREMMDRHVADCAECRENAVVLRRMQAAVNEDVTIPMPPRSRFDELLAAVDRQDAAAAPTAWLTPRAIAAGVAIAIIGALALVSRFDSTPDTVPVFETATSVDTTAVTDYVFAIEFQPNITAARRAAIIAAFGGTELGADDQPHVVRVAVPVPAATLEELAGFTDEVAANDGVVQVRVVAVQLPIE